jgi:hypothetical protein
MDGLVADGRQAVQAAGRRSRGRVPRSRFTIQPSPVPRCLPILCFALGCALLAAGCDVRDEQARSGPATPWLESTARRLATPVAPEVARPMGGRVECFDGFEAGSRRAAEAGLPLMLVFRATWCRWSGDLMETVLADGRLAALGGRFVCVSIDADREAAICRSFGVGAFPTVILLDADRREQFRATGAAARQGLAAAVETAVLRPRSRVAGLPPDGGASE